MTLMTLLAGAALATPADPLDAVVAAARDPRELIQRLDRAPLGVTPVHANFLFPYRYGETVVLLDPASQFMDNLVVQSSNAGGEDTLEWLVRELYEAFFSFHTPDYDFLVVLSSSAFGSGGSFYAPIANDIQGLGMESLTNGDSYDGDPTGSLQGMLFLNSAPVWSRNETAGRYTFGQILGARWCGMADLDVPGLPSDALVSGRGTWSYWMNTSNSPCGGNDWQFTGGDTRTAFNYTDSAYTDLDLYMMGLLGPEEVDDFELLEVDPKQAADVDRHAGSPPEYINLFGLFKDLAVTVSPEIHTLGVQDIIAANGPRVPSAEDSQRSFRVAFAYLSFAADPLDQATLDKVEALRQTFEANWEEDVGGLAELDTTLGASLAEEIVFEGQDTGLDTGGAVDTGDTAGDSGADGATAPGDDTDPPAEDEPFALPPEPACACGVTGGAAGLTPAALLALVALLRRRR